MATEKRLIDANALIQNHGSDVTNFDNPYAVKISSIENALTVDAVEVVHGRWMEFNLFMTCSECDTDWYYGDNDCDRFDYCPKCGAKMDGAQ